MVEKRRKHPENKQYLSEFWFEVKNSSRPLEQWDFEERYENTTNVLGLVVFSIVFGISLGKLGQKGQLLIDFFQALSEGMMIITSWVIW